MCFPTSRQEVESHLRPRRSLIEEFFTELLVRGFWREHKSEDCLQGESETGILDVKLLKDLSGCKVNMVGIKDPLV